MSQQTEGDKSWQDSIPMVAEGNAFGSSDLFYCKVGTGFDLKTEEEYQRALKVSQTYPGDFKILRYEGYGWTPCIYNTFRGDCIVASEYIMTGNEDILTATM